ncbi:serine/arginine repetitive matrix protein 1 isoform X1 [Tenebrio molitor]|uniref:serine/arginine repetitive matrix protein 1 isoform X1 n=1 Tax=Tenebrio molitor TaxID=7067 RepID=UPI0036249226
MSSRRRSRSRERSKNANTASKLRMDTKPQTPRITGNQAYPSLPAGRRREIDTVMKKARASPNSNAYWDKKLLEVEAKDPNRWRHSGYKSLYMDGSSSPSSGRRSRSRSATGRRSPPRRSPVGRRSPRSPVGRRSPRSPPPRRSPVGRRSPPRRSPLAYSRSPVGRRSPPPAARSRPARPRSPPPHKASASGRRSASASSISSCSDDSCSVCSPKNHRHPRSRSRSFSVPRSRVKTQTKTTSPTLKSRVRPRPPSPSPSPPRRMPRPMTPPPARKLQKPSSSDRPTDPRRQPPPPRPRGRTGEVIDVTGVKPPLKPVRKMKEKGSEPVLLTRIKKERTKKRTGSPGESSGSEDSDTSSTSPIVATTRLTLSERFGKIAQWSADRERRDIENMRITKTGGDLKVMIEGEDFIYGSPPRRYSLSPVPAGHYPDELLSSGPSRLAAWDDVRVRYQYYKDLGYLRDLTLEDYVKWEEWWYKYQDWLTNERHYEHWLSTQRRRRKRIPATQRLN